MFKSQRKFYELPLPERLELIATEAGITSDELTVLDGVHGLTPKQADHMIENAVGVYGLPLGVARNFLVNGREVLVQMAIKEPSVVAAVSFMAKLARTGRGFTTEATAPEMIG